MYYEHFGLSGAPFEFNPSASVLFMSAGHREGLAALEWGLREPSGFTMLVGEIGAGKTTLIYSLLASRHQGVRSAWVANPRLSFTEMLRQILGQLGVSLSQTSDKLALLQAFDTQLASLGPDECVAVIIDEAQDLSDDALEDLRLLSNFQSLERRRLQIVLVGQIELARRLSAPQLRQLNQRIGARALLPVLQGKEIYDYVEYRLRSRGGDIERLFTRGAIRELMRSSGGIPRRINVLCHNALMLAFSEGEESADVQHVRDAVHDYDRLLASRASAPVQMAASVSEAIRSASARFARMAPPTASRRRPTLRAAAAGALAALCLLAIAGAGYSELRPFRETLTALSVRYASQDKQPQPQILAQWSPAQFKTRSDETAKPAPKPLRLAPLNVHDGSAGSANELIMRGPAGEPSTSVLPAPGQPKPETSPATNVIPVKLSSAGNISAPAPASADATISVRVGDTLSKIAKRLYGSFGSDELGRLTAANPQIKDMNVIYPGQSIRVTQTGK
jgi:type II secretory pathway predicted ATPase ExeA/nucleoid-associated protein YgaU